MTGGILEGAAVGKALSLLSGAAGYLLLSVGVASATYWVTSRGYQTEIEKIHAGQAKADAASWKAGLDQFITDSKAIHEAAQIFQNNQINLQEKLDEINRAFTAAAAAAPLPAGCKPDAGRLRSLAAAIAAANSSFSSPRGRAGSALPGTGSSKPH